ncbi:MAG TPA: stage V sporulation protein AA [Clostridiales bacterium]|nr:stage V sporulation protein AA [Clostridiales bacterium]
MSNVKKDTLYIKAEKITILNKKKIALQDIIEIYSLDKSMVEELNKQIILNVQDFNKEHKYVISVLDIIKTIVKKYPELEIINLGETDFIVNFEPHKEVNKYIEYIKTAFVILTIFFGSAFAIMAFNSDGQVKDIFNLIYKLFMRADRVDGKILEIAYSIGIPLGTIIFFNHFSKAKIDDDPTPLQIQMRVYEEDAYKTIIENSNRDKNNINKFVKDNKGKR